MVGITRVFLVIASWVIVLWFVGLVFHLPMWLAVTTVHLTELIAGLFLGFMGVIIAGDFRGWWKASGNDGSPKLAGAVLLVLYFAALMIWRYV